jgi:elongator complex protein 3
MNIHEELIDRIKKGEIKNQEDLEKEKVILAKKYGINNIIKNADIIASLDKNDKNYRKLVCFLQTKPIRTSSGVANIAVMWFPRNSKGISCPGECIYCPQGRSIDAKGVVHFAPQSYTGVEPATMRAIREKFDPFRQVTNRLKQLSIIGHPTDKCELIIMGGTFLCASKKFQEGFVKRCFDALNDNKSKTLEEAQKRNEKAKHRCVGLTIETRADYCKKEHIEQMLRLGCTRVEIGAQSTSDDILKMIKRGHLSQDNKEAIRLLKESGLKVCLHWMPGLTGLYGKVDKEKEIKLFKELFTENYRPDELKIYPVLVIHGTELYGMWQKGRYAPLKTEEAIGLLIELKKIVPKYVRVKRIMRDISHREVSAGPSATNMRQIVHERMKENGIRCNCIRCREIRKYSKGKAKMNKIGYNASGGKEFFISFDDNNNRLLAFLRLRIDNSDSAKVRELHVYGPMIEIGKTGAIQHKGYGKKLLKEAENIAKRYGKKKIRVTSGIGVREYYKKLDYKREKFYMTKRLN